MLVKKTKSLCPACKRVLDATIVEEDNKIWLERTCPDHGFIKSLYWSDSRMYHRFQNYEAVGTGIEEPVVPGETDTCPQNCGLCSGHHSATMLGNIDVTNRCNLNCDFCFANAQACGFLYEPSFDEIVGMMKNLRNERPVPPPAVQFSGGEPTMREDLPDMIREAKSLGFSQVQIASNGIKLAQDISLVQRLKDAGLSTIYLHFDGISETTNPILATSRKVISNCAEVGMAVVLVPTVIRGRNDHEVGAIIRYAAENIKVVRGVNFQPIAFTGAASADDVARERVTIPDLTADIETQTGGALRQDDFYPIPCVAPFTHLVEEYTGRPQVAFTAHQHCGAATYIFVNGDEIVPVNRMIDVEKFLQSVDHMAMTLARGGSVSKYKALLEGVKEIHASLKKRDSGKTGEIWRLIATTLVKQNFDALREFHWNALFIGTMHFMDDYNYDLDRVQRCCIHYATPDGRIIPFCTYNSGPVYREQIWKQYSRPLPAKRSETPHIGKSATETAVPSGAAPS